MKTSSTKGTAGSLNRALKRQAEGEKYLLRLYVSGMTRRAAVAIDNIKTFCEQHLRGRYDLEVIDIYQQPALAKSEQIIAAPTLIKKLPPPLRRFIGDMSRTEKLLVGLDLRPAQGPAFAPAKADEAADSRGQTGGGRPSPAKPKD